MERYNKILNKRKREIVLLRGRGCIYKKCTFCDYHLDKCEDEEQNFLLNQEVLEKVSGEFKDLEVINSGSVFELDKKTLNLIRQIAKEKGIECLHFEAHALYKDKIPSFRKQFSDFKVKMKLGLETFDYDIRENVLKKGIKEKDYDRICSGFDEANFLFGITGQTLSSMEKDIELGLRYFERICINIMCKNTTQIEPDVRVIETFMNNLYPKYKDNERVDILIDKTDFGVGD